MVEIRLGRVVLRVNIAVTGVLILAVNFHMTVEAREVEKELSRTFMRVLLGLSGKRRCYRCQHMKAKVGSLAKDARHSAVCKAASELDEQVPSEISMEVP